MKNEAVDSFFDGATPIVVRGDVLAIGKTKWVVVRNIDSYNAYVYKHPSKHTKLYQVQAVDDSNMVVFEVGGSGQRLGADIVTGPVKKTGGRVEL